MIHAYKCNQCQHAPVCKYIENYRIACDIVYKTVDELPLETQFRYLDIECERLEKENERLNTEVALLHTDYTYKFVKAKAKAEAYKECIEKVKELIKGWNDLKYYSELIKAENDLDNLLKEFEKKINEDK